MDYGIETVVFEPEYRVRTEILRGESDSEDLVTDATIQ